MKFKSKMTLLIILGILYLVVSVITIMGIKVLVLPMPINKTEIVPSVASSNIIVSNKTSPTSISCASISISETGETGLITSSETIAEVESTAQPKQVTRQYGEVVPPIYGQQYGSIICEVANISAPLYWGDDDTLLSNLKGVYQYANSSQIGYDGCHLLLAHNNGVFGKLKKVSIGDEFIVKTDYGVYVYLVTSCRAGTVSADNGTIVADDGSILVDLGDTADALYMYTCYPFNEYGTTNQRYVVRAVLNR